MTIKEFSERADKAIAEAIKIAPPDPEWMEEGTRALRERIIREHFGKQ